MRSGGKTWTGRNRQRRRQTRENGALEAREAAAPRRKGRTSARLARGGKSDFALQARGSPQRRPQGSPQPWLGWSLGGLHFNRAALTCIFRAKKGSVGFAIKMKMRGQTVILPLRRYSSICDVKFSVCRREYAAEIPARTQRIDDQLLLGAITWLLQVRKDQPQPIAALINRLEQFRDVVLGVCMKLPIYEARIPFLQIEIEGFHCVVIDPHLVSRCARSGQFLEDTLGVFILPVGPQPEHTSVA